MNSDLSFPLQVMSPENKNCYSLWWYAGKSKTLRSVYLQTVQLLAKFNVQSKKKTFYISKDKKTSMWVENGSHLEMKNVSGLWVRIAHLIDTLFFIETE